MRPLVRCLPALAAVALLAAPAGAQQLYKYVGPDGRVQYTDRLPPGAQKRGKGHGLAGKHRRAGRADHRGRPSNRARPRRPRSRSRRSGSGAPKLRRTPRSRRRSHRTDAHTTSNATRCDASLPGYKRVAGSPCPTRRASASFSTTPRSRMRARGCSAKSRPTAIRTRLAAHLPGAAIARRLRVDHERP